MIRRAISAYFILRTQHLQTQVPKESWGVLKQSGASPRYWQFARNSDLLERPEWLELEDPGNEVWLNEVVLIVFGMPTFQITDDKEVVRKTILGWMNGGSYDEIASYYGIDMEEVLNLLQHTIGYKLLKGMTQLTQLAMAAYDIDDMSELAISWPLLLQYGLADRTYARGIKVMILWPRCS